MKIEYERWNGAGDLLDIVNNLDGRYDKFFLDTEAKHKMVVASGANGIMELKAPAEKSNDKFNLVFHSGLGLCGPIPLCGNGSRCSVGYACSYGIVPREQHAEFSFMAGDGRHSGSCKVDEINKKHFVKISMRDIDEVIKVTDDIWFANCGTAHLVKFIPVGTANSVDLMSEGRKLSKQYNHLAPGLLVIVNFVEDRPDGVFCRCYDTAFDEEIFACGTASMSIAVIHASYKGEMDGATTKNVNWSGGQIVAGYKKDGNKYKDLSLQSHVFREEKGFYNY